MRLLCLLLFALPALAQFESNSLEVTATRTLTIQPDVVTFNVYVTASATISMDAILAALPQPFTANDFVSAGSGLPYIGSGTQWYFSKSLPIASMGSALTALNSAQTKLGTSMTFTFYTQSGASPTAKAANPCPYGALMSDANTQAQQTASAAGLKLGPVVGLSDGSVLPEPADQDLVYPLEAVACLSSEIGAGPATSSCSVELVAPPAPPATCTLVVRFQLRQ